jgi:hypothetical protein
LTGVLEFGVGGALSIRHIGNGKRINVTRIAPNRGELVGDSFVPSGNQIVRDGTVQLDRNITTSNGQTIPAGSIVTENGGAIRVQAPDGTVITGRTSDVVDNNIIALPAPNSGLRIPQGFTERQFDGLSSTVRGRVDQLGLGDDIFVQGSRAGGTAGPNSDLDIAIRVSPERFDEIMNDPSIIDRRILNPNPGSAADRTRQTAIDRGRLHAGEAGLSDLRNQLQGQFGTDVDISIIRAGGPFDNGPQTPLSFGFE